MNKTLARLSWILALAGCFVFAGDRSAISQSDSPGPPSPAVIPAAGSEQTEELGYQVLMRGPVHEAFAAPSDSDLTDGSRVYDNPPPEPVDEQPPGDPPAGEGMKWFPGYWTWMDEQNDYVWVSGLWRKVPPGRTWTSGRWSETTSGHHRWTPGYWGSDEAAPETSAYLPMPPQSIDNGPSILPPGDDYFWVPGCWQYADSAYRWRSGFWSVQQSNWVWQPACYQSTPQGFVYVDGYWDYLPTDRGQLYAPVHFDEPVYLQPNYVYQPRYPLVRAASLLLNLYVRSGYPHYYYGHFHGPSYASLGYRPWYDYGHGYGYGYGSPWLGYYDWKYRKSGINFVGSMHRYEKHLHDNPSRVLSPHASAKPHLSGSAARVSELRLGNPKSSRSMDDAVRSEFGRVAISSNRNRSNAAAQRAFSVPAAGFSNRSAVSRQLSGDDFSPRNSFQSNHGRVNGLPSSSARLQSTIGPSSIGRSSMGTSNLGRSNSSPSMRSGTLPSSNGMSGRSSFSSPRSMGSSANSFSRSLNSHFPSSRSVGSSSTQRSLSPSLNRGSSSGISGRSNFSGGSSRGNVGGGSNRSSMRSGNSKSLGSRGRGKGK